MRTHPGFAAYLVLGMLLCLTAAQPVSAPAGEPVAALPFPGPRQSGFAMVVITGVSCHPVPRIPRSTGAGQPAGVAQPAPMPKPYPGPAEWKAFHDSNRRASLPFRDRGELSVEVAGAHIDCVKNVVGVLRQLRLAGLDEVGMVEQILPNTGLTEVVVRPPYFAGWTGLACLVGSLGSDTSVVVVPRKASGDCL